jgi:hypothetical protein
MLPVLNVRQFFRHRALADIQIAVSHIIFHSIKERKRSLKMVFWGSFVDGICGEVMSHREVENQLLDDS